MLFPPFRRTWILEHHAQESLDAACHENPKVEDEIRGVEWMLVRSPELGTQVAPDVYLYVNRRATLFASLITVLYSYTEAEVTVLRIWIR